MLNQVSPIVATSHVSQFVAQHMLGYFEAGIRWQEYDWLKKP
jgi:hypothetical protein